MFSMKSLHVFFVFFSFSVQRCDTNPNLVCAKEVHFCIQLDTEQISALAALQTGSVLHLDSETQISWLKQVNSGRKTPTHWSIFIRSLEKLLVLKHSNEFGVNVDFFARIAQQVVI